MGGRGLIRRIKGIPVRLAEEKFLRETLGGFEGRFAPQLFILGLPRSGTTLVYQYIVHRYHVAYFTNGVGNRAHDPCRTTAGQMRDGAPYQSDFQSKYGRSQGAMAPREAGNFWLRFFDLDAYQSMGDIDTADAHTMRRSIQCIQALFEGAPFVNKNVKHMLRIDALAKLFPEAHFLVIERGWSDVALSLLRARIKLFNDDRHWFSVRPPEYDALCGLEGVDQVVGQVVALERRMQADFSRLDAGRVHRLSYSEFCNRPDTVFDVAAPVFVGVAEKNPAVPRFDIVMSKPQNDVEGTLLRKLAEAVGP